MNRNILSGFSNRKGISPLIAAVLLIAFTMAVASLFAQWAPGLISDAQDQASDQRQEVQSCSGVVVEVLSVGSDNKSATIQQTSGSTPADNVTVVWQYSDGTPPAQNASVLRGTREARLIKANDVTATDPQLDSVRVSPQCGGASGETATWQELAQ